MWDGLPEERRKLGRAEITKPQALKLASDRERRYIDALAQFLNADPAQTDRASARYVQAMAALHAAYPRDHEAAAFYALGILVGTDPADPAGTGRQALAAAADLQDAFGQNEVDIPVREMYGDMLLTDGRPADALVQYRTSLANSPNRFNGLCHAGRAAEQAGESGAARDLYAQLLTVIRQGAQFSRPEFTHARAHVATHNKTVAKR